MHAILYFLIFLFTNNFISKANLSQNLRCEFKKGTLLYFRKLKGREMKLLITICLIFLIAGCQSDSKQTKGQNTMKEEVQKVLKSKEGVQMLHQQFSAHTFNECWKYIEKADRSEEDIENMLILANTSLWHWKKRKDCTPKNLSIAYWQLGRVNVLAKDRDLAKRYAAKCLKVSLENKLDPFCIGYAYEVSTDSAILNGNKADAMKYLEMTKENLSKVTDDFDKKLLTADLKRLEKLVQGMK